ncbi:hypothetical protein B2J88_07920 [Rhodococcus sp. SRB_17]|nr:hypothetical protein [Rhodococcus sp. SRB_17]
MTTTTLPPDQLFTLEEAAERMKCSKAHYREQLRMRKWPGRKIANKWRVTETDIQEALQITYSAPIHRPVPDPVSARPGTRRRYERRHHTK